MTCDDLKEIIGDMYELENYIIDRIEFFYDCIVGKKGNTTYVRIDNDNEVIANNSLKLVDIKYLCY